MSNRCLKKLGLSVLDVLKEAMTVTKGTLDGPSYELFWEVLDSCEWDPKERLNHANLIPDLMHRILSHINYTMKRKGSTLQEIQPLLNTLCFLSLSYTLEGNVSVIASQVKEFQKLHNARGRPFPSCEETIRIISKVIEGELSVETLIRNVSMLMSSEDLEFFENFLDHPSLKSTEVNGGETMALWSRLQNLIMDERFPEKIPQNVELALKCILQNLRALVKSFKTSPELISSQVLALLHIFKVLIVITPIADSDLLARAVLQLRDFATWPRPCADLVIECLTMAKFEMKVRGFAMLERFLEESKLPQMKFGREESGLEFWSQPLFLFMEKESIRSASLFKVCKMKLYQIPESIDAFQKSKTNIELARGLVPFTQLQLIYQIISSNLGSTSELPLMLTYLDPDVLSEIFYQMSVISYEGVALNGSDESNLVYIQDKFRGIMEMISNSLRDYVTLHDATSEQLTSAPLIPFITPVAVVDSLAKTVIGESSSNVMSTRFSFLFEDLVSRHGSLSDSSDPTVIRLMVAGSDRLMHGILCAYTQLAQDSPHLLDGIQIKWYVIPIEENSIASFIARHDPWYRRHVFIPFANNLPLIPWPNMDNSSLFVEESEGEAVGPGKFYSQLLESYARDAASSVDIVIHQLLCWEQDIGGPANLVIPFLIRVEISAQSLLKARQYTDNDSRSTKSSPILTVQYLSAAESGEALKTVQRELGLETVILANVPVADDLCNLSIPTERGVEFYGRLVDSVSKRRNQEIRGSVASLEVSAQAKGERFYVLVDGQSYGPFHKVIFLLDDPSSKPIFPSRLSKNSDLRNVESSSKNGVISFQTFFPILN